jgi:hypothetical protein
MQSVLRHDRDLSICQLKERSSSWLGSPRPFAFFLPPGRSCPAQAGHDEFSFD